MIFLTERIGNSATIEVEVYASLADVAERVEWQDILSDFLTVLDEQGNVYVWDNTKSNEAGTTYDYSFRIKGADLHLAKLCLARFRALGQPPTFEITEIE
ncbi:MAG TPA: hypothetical protein VGD65_25800 [Chryseosolibacter sp.]